MDETEGEEACRTGDETIPTTQENLAQLMDVIMIMLLDLSRKVQASEAQLKEWTTTSLSAAHSVRRRARHQTTLPMQEPDVSEVARGRVEQWLQYLPLSEEVSSDDSDEEQPTTQKYTS